MALVRVLSVLEGSEEIKPSFQYCQSPNSPYIWHPRRDYFDLEDLRNIQNTIRTPLDSVTHQKPGFIMIYDDFSSKDCSSKAGTSSVRKISTLQYQVVCLIMIVAIALSFDMIIPSMSTLVSTVLRTSEVLAKLLTNLTNILLRSITIFFVGKYL
jgi:hypothetical protein